MVADVVASGLGSTACPCQWKWSRFLHWCHEWNVNSCSSADSGVFLYLPWELKLSVPEVQEYRSSLNHAFITIRSLTSSPPNVQTYTQSEKTKNCPQTTPPTITGS